MEKRIISFARAFYGVMMRQDFLYRLGAMGRIFFGGMLMFAVGCASVENQIIGENYVKKRSFAAMNSRKCMDDIKNNNPVYERLNESFIYDLNDNHQLSKLVNKKYVTKQNVDDLIKFREMIQPCYDQVLVDYGDADDRYADYMLVIRLESDLNLLDLLNKKITIGDRNAYILETLVVNRQKFTEIDKEVMEEIKNGQNYEYLPYVADPDDFDNKYDYLKVHLLQEQLRSLSQPDIGQQTPQADSRASSPNCYFIGNTIRCDQ